MKTKKLLKLLEKINESELSEGLFPVIVMYDDGSGRVVQNIHKDVYDTRNCMLYFNNLKELKRKMKKLLKEK